MSAEPLDRLREILLSLPDVSERLSHGEPAWFYKEKKSIATFADHHHDDRLAFWCAAPEGVQEARIAADPTRFFRPPYVGHRGWLGVYLDVDVEVDWDDVRGIAEDAHRTVSQRR